MSRRQPAPTDLRPSGATDIVNAQYVALRQRILEGSLPPGSPIVESAVSTEAGVSRTPVREALVRLEADGLVERSPRGGIRVRVRAIEEILELHEVRLTLEVEAARLAARRRTEIDLARLRRVQGLEAAQLHGNGSISLHHEWHTVLRAASHNGALAEALDRYDALVHVYDRVLMDDYATLEENAREHTVIFTALLEQRADDAGELMREHSRRIQERHLQALVESGL